MKKNKIAFIGMSHLGLISAICAAEKGYQIVGFDSNSENIKKLKANQLLFSEPNLPALFKKNKKNLQFTDKIEDISDCEIIYISQDVPTNTRGVSDLEKIFALIDAVQMKMNNTAILVILSQVPPGFTRSLRIEKARLFYQVETLIFGRAVERALFPERFIIGADNKKILQVFENYLNTYECPIFVMKYESAELSKVAINMYLVSSVTTTNTIAELCEEIGAEWEQIIPVLKLDKRIGPHAYLKPGLGIAGGNLERDLVTFKTLANKYDTNASIINTWQKHSEYRSCWILKKFNEIFKSKKDKKNIGVLGLAYKENTASIKNSPALKLISNLKHHNIQAYDPVVKRLPEEFNFVKLFRNIKDIFYELDVLFIMTPWNEFKSINPKEISLKLKEKTIFDPYGILEKESCKKYNIKHYKLGS